MGSDEFQTRFREFMATEWSSATTRARRGLWLDVRDESRVRWSRALSLRAQGQPYVDVVLGGLLPYADTPTNRARDRWVHPSSTLSIDLRAWFEREGWTLPADWPVATHAVMQLIERCLLCPEKLQEICDRFTQHAPVRGFQSSLLSPILNALVPDRYRLVNARSLAVLRAFTGVPWSPKLETYPRVNEALGAFIDKHRATLDMAPAEGHAPGDVLDLFACWFVTKSADAHDEAWERVQTSTKESADLRCWKVAPGEHAQRWFKCLADDSMAFAWPELGDLSRMSRDDFAARVSALAAQDAAYRDTGVEQLWSLARDPAGAVLVAARKTTMVLGVGRVIGAYRFAPHEPFPHRLEVDWFDPTERSVLQPEWERPIVSLEPSWVEDSLGVSFSAVHARLRDVAPERSATRAEQSVPVPVAVNASVGVVRARPSAFTAPTVRMDFGDDARAAAAPALPSRAPLVPTRTSTLVPTRAITERRSTPSPNADRRRSTPVVPPPGERRLTPLALHVDGAAPRKGTSVHHTLSRCAEDTGFPEDEIRRWVETVRRRGQAIVSGPTGTGKTFLARHLAQHLASGDGIVEQLQFHPGYRYEDFLERGEGDARAPGRFLEFLAKAQGRMATSVLVIDEIQRADIPRVLGEALHALEYRAQAVRLASGTELVIPRNIVVLATMNVSERTINLADQTLRRRFAFIPLPPRFDALARYLGTRGFDATGLIEMLQAVNRTLGNPDHALGTVSFFRDDLHESLEDIWSHEVVPHLELHLRDPHALDEFRWDNVQGAMLGRSG